MFFGMPTLIELNTVEDCAALCKELGLQFVELNMNLPQCQLNRIDVPYFKEIAEKYGISTRSIWTKTWMSATLTRILQMDTGAL